MNVVSRRVLTKGQKMFLKRVIKTIKNPYYIFNFLSGKYDRLHWIPDATYLKLMFRGEMGKKLNLKNPETFNEKLQWLKLYDRRPEYTDMVDKYKVRQYVADRIGEEYLVPLLGVWSSFDDIDFSKLPNQFVLKCNHDCGSVFICKDKSKFDPSAIRSKFVSALKKNYYFYGREWPYKNVVPKIIAEAYLEDAESKQLRDYKIFTFNGKPKMLFVASDRQSESEETKFDFFDLDFNRLPFTNGHPNSVSNSLPRKPLRLGKMFELAEKLATGIPHVRVDFYEVNGKIYFGETTFSHWSGWVRFEPDEWDKKIGDWLELPQKKS